MTIEQMRDAVIKLYPSPRWKQKVMRMHDNQVIAIFRSSVERKRLGPRGRVIKKREMTKKDPWRFTGCKKEYAGEQLSFI